MPIDKHHTGQQAVLKFPPDVEVPVSNVDWDRNVNTTENQLNDSLKAAIAITGLRYSGTFEFDGKNDDIRSAMWNDDPTNLDVENHPVVHSTMTVKETPSTQADSDVVTRTYKFDTVVITGESRSIPGDDNSSTTYNWMAEDVTVTTS